jgi:hypothetical protein
MLEDELFLDQLKAGMPDAYVVLLERFEGPLYRFFLCDHPFGVWLEIKLAQPSREAASVVIEFAIDSTDAG